MKKRTLILGLLALEIASIPVAAQIWNQFKPETPQRAVSVPLPSDPGHMKFAVVSNAPFAVISENMIGPTEVSVFASGTINDKPFGENAQPPGPDSVCAVTNTHDPQKIYIATDKTAVREGPILSKTVIVSILYPSDETPKFTIQSEKDSRKFPSAPHCEV